MSFLLIFVGVGLILAGVSLLYKAYKAWQELKELRAET